jgi:tetratricopeptide (TPR) repeat protein
MFRYKGKNIDPQTVGHELHVKAVLSGKLMERGDSIVLRAELVDVNKGFQIWGGQFTRKTSDVLALQDDLSREVSDQLQLRLTGEQKQQLAKRYTEDAEAYQLYLRGRYFWHKWTPEGYFKSIEYFQRAIDKDPSFALAYTGLADAYNTLARNDLPPWEAGPKAQAAAEKAVALDDQLVQARVSLAWVEMAYDWDWAAAGQNLREAIALKPAYPGAHDIYGAYLSAVGRFDDAVAEGRRAVELDPASPSMIIVFGQRLYFAGRSQEARQQFSKAIEMDPNLPDAYMWLGLAYLEMKQYREALAEFTKVQSPRATALAGYAHAMLHERQKALRSLNELQALARQKYVSPMNFAIVYMGLNDKDEAFRQLTQARDDHYATMPWVNTWPLFAPLRSDPRFAELVRPMGLTAASP